MLIMKYNFLFQLLQCTLQNYLSKKYGLGGFRKLIVFWKYKILPYSRFKDFELYTQVMSEEKVNKFLSIRSIHVSCHFHKVHSKTITASQSAWKTQTEFF